MGSGLERTDAVIIQGWKFLAKKREEKGKVKKSDAERKEKD